MMQKESGLNGNDYNLAHTRGDRMPLIPDSVARWKGV